MLTVIPEALAGARTAEGEKKEEGIPSELAGAHTADNLPPEPLGEEAGLLAARSPRGGAEREDAREGYSPILTVELHSLFRAESILSRKRGGERIPRVANP